MEKKSSSIAIDTEEELLEHFSKIYTKCKNEEYSIAMKDAENLLKKLTLVEAKAREYGLISPNEEVSGRPRPPALILRNRTGKAHVPDAALLDCEGPFGDGRREQNRAHSKRGNVLRDLLR